MRSIKFRGSGCVERSLYSPTCFNASRKIKFSLVILIVYVSQIVNDESERMHKNSAGLSLTFGPDITYRLSWNHEMSACVRIPTSRGVKVPSIQLL